MPVEQRFRRPELGQDFLVGHERQLGAHVARFNALESARTPPYKAADFTGTPS
jgi:hypothetical protein